ncbi:MAG: porphobilinogen synthase [Rickettsiales bacterium]
MINRPRRLRANQTIRSLVHETRLSVDDLIHPIFVKEGSNSKTAISSMEGHYQLSLNDLDKEIIEIQKLGIKAVLLFGILSHKDAEGKASTKHSNVVYQAIKQIKERAPEMVVIADVCLCEYTDHGHCGKLNKEKSDVDNDSTIEILADQAASFAEAGADIVAPSAMMDGMVGAIRDKLDSKGFKNCCIMSYSVKYASNMYGPFREAAEGAPKFGDRKTYQMDYANSNEALKEAALDVDEGADFLMVKPAHTYLDIIYKIKQNFPEMPLAAYHTSGEFAMIKASAKSGMVNEFEAVLEVTTAIKRAGANLIISYFAKDLAKHLRK